MPPRCRLSRLHGRSTSLQAKSLLSRRSPVLPQKPTVRSCHHYRRCPQQLRQRRLKPLSSPRWLPLFRNQLRPGTMQPPTPPPQPPLQQPLRAFQRQTSLPRALCPQGHQPKAFIPSKCGVISLLAVSTPPFVLALQVGFLQGQRPPRRLKPQRHRRFTTS